MKIYTNLSQKNKTLKKVKNYFNHSPITVNSSIKLTSQTTLYPYLKTLLLFMTSPPSLKSTPNNLLTPFKKSKRKPLILFSSLMNISNILKSYALYSLPAYTTISIKYTATYLLMNLYKLCSI